MYYMLTYYGVGTADHAVNKRDTAPTLTQLTG